MRIEKNIIGFREGREIYLFEMSNDNNVSIKITNYGATITSIITPDHKGNLEEITCGFDSVKNYFSEEYLINNPYFGATIGRCASRIEKSSFKLEGNIYNLPENDRGNHLHGGTNGFDKKIWQASYEANKNSSCVTMKLKSYHLEQGYPGNLNIEVRFELNNINELSISYYAETDKTTPISLTNHTYFNLSGFKEDIANHKVQINSDHILELDTFGIANGNKILLNQEPGDFREEKLLGDAMKFLEKGYDHYYLFDNNFLLHKVATFFHPSNKRALDISTTEPGMQFYTGYYISDKLKRENGDQYGKFTGFCCETHRYPNAPNLDNAPKSITYPEDPYRSQTVFKFYTY
ncbi:aldose epimerase family protein [uncultured Aquimarina sp.]|uniref:aldose epimerase family protein n=1 Tax=uncultured Aquimarina sp. TaxID=575652 RepID=UPI0026375D8D|nr:aldose epimerase family protein [uncultured Aquimarina sp.]